MPKIPTIPGLDFGMGNAITEKDDNSSDIKHEGDDDSSDSSSVSEFDEIKELKMRVGLIAQKSLNQQQMSKDKSTMSSQK